VPDHRESAMHFAEAVAVVEVEGGGVAFIDGEGEEFEFF